MTETDFLQLNSEIYELVKEPFCPTLAYIAHPYPSYLDEWMRTNFYLSLHIIARYQPNDEVHNSNKSIGAVVQNNARS